LSESLLRHRAFMRFWFARLAGTSANQMLMVAIGWQMYDLTASAWDLGLVGLMQFMPSLLLVLVAGHVLDRYHRARILAACMALQAAVAAALALAAWQGWASRDLLLALSVLIGAAARRLPVEARGTASGIINAGGSFGQFLFAPILQKLIQTVGWVNAMWAMALMALTALPLVGRLTRPVTTPPPTHAEAEQGLMQAIRGALVDRSYLLLHLGFFTCGFHIAFLVTHLPGEVDLCGLPPAVASWSLAIIGLANLFGSLYAGSCVSRYRSKYVLAVMYGSRVLLIAGYLLLPSSALTFYVFAAGLGFTWLATVPPTAALVSKLFGVRYLGTLFGLTLLSHQIGGFLGAWLGGLAVVEFGNYSWMWYADMALAAMAAVINLPIREARIERSLVGLQPD